MTGLEEPSVSLLSQRLSEERVKSLCELEGKLDLFMEEKPTGGECIWRNPVQSWKQVQLDERQDEGTRALTLSQHSWEGEAFLTARFGKNLGLMHDGWKNMFLS